MTKQIKDLFEVYKSKSPDEQRFVDKHVTIKHKDRNGNGDDVFQATNIKKVKRKSENHGYETGEDEAVYESASDDNNDRYVGNWEYQRHDGSYTKARVAKHPEGGYHVHWGDGSKSHVKGNEEMERTIDRKGMVFDWKNMKEETLDEVRGRSRITHNSAGFMPKGNVKPTDDISKALSDIDAAFAKKPTKDEQPTRKPTKKDKHFSEEVLDEVRGRSYAKPGKSFYSGATGPAESRPKTEKDKELDKGLDAIQAAFAAAKKKTVKEETLDELSHQTGLNYLNKVYDKASATKTQPSEKRLGYVKKVQSKLDAHWKKQLEDSKEADKQKVLNRTPKVHDLRHLSHGEVYDKTQTSDNIHDGDVLHVKGGSAIMYRAWPTMVHGQSKELHSWDSKHSWNDPEVAHYGRAVKIAKSLKEDFQDEAFEPWMGKDTDKPAYLRKKEYEDNKKDANPPKALKRVKEDIDLQELSKETLKSYVNKGDRQYDSALNRVWDREDAAGRIYKDNYAKKAHLDRKPGHKEDLALIKRRERGEKSIALRGIRNEEVENLDEAKKITAGSLGALLDKSVKKTKDGNFRVGREFFYRHGKTSDQHAQSVSKSLNDAGIKHEIVDHGEVNNPFRGGESTWRNSHFWADVKIHPDAKINEDYQIDELSKKTLGSYAKKAVDKLRSAENNAGFFDANDKPLSRQRNQFIAGKRTRGIKKAVDKLTTEELAAKVIAKYAPEISEFEKLSIDEMFVAKLLDQDISENHVEKLLELFNSLDEQNQIQMLGLAEDLDMVNEMLDFAISQLDELSKDTLNSYMTKANEYVTRKGYNPKTASKSPKVIDKVIRREKSQFKALSRLAKEETDLQELSKEAMSSYVKKANKNLEKHDREWNKLAQKDSFTPDEHKAFYKHDSEAEKRYAGISRAKKKMDKN